MLPPCDATNSSMEPPRLDSAQRQSSPIRSVLSFFTRPKPFAFNGPENGSAYSLHPIHDTPDENPDSSPPMNATNSTSETLLALSRQTAHLQNTLQSLLDAQSNGLLAGLGRPPQPATSSKHPKKYDARSPSSRIASPRAQSKENFPQNISLQNARVQIHSTLLSLSEIKFTESRILASQVSSRSDFLASLEALVDKKTNLEAEISSIETGEGGYDSINKLETEEKDLTTKIEELETTLAELKARLLHVKRRKDEDTNRIEARLSSWKGALKEVESKLSGPIFDGRSFDGTVISTLNLQPKDNPAEERVNVWTLPRARRTLEMIRDSVDTDRTFLYSQQEAAEIESSACTEGAEVWKSVVKSVRKVEKRVASELSGSSPPSKPSTLSPSPSTHLLPKSRTPSFGSSTTTGSIEPKSTEERAKAVLELMGTTAGKLERYLRVAEEKGWRLLVCSIGGELEALIEAKEMLEAVILPTSENLSETLAASEVRDDVDVEGGAKLMASGVMLKGKERMNTHQPLVDLSGDADARGGFEDDGPPLDLLTSVD